jgi:hypothetical protein
MAFVFLSLEKCTQSVLNLVLIVLVYIRNLYVTYVANGIGYCVNY